MYQIEILEKIKKLTKEANKLYELGKFNQYCKIEDIIFNYVELYNSLEPQR